METLTQATSAIDIFAAKVSKDTAIVKSVLASSANALADWCAQHPRAALSITCFVFGFILGTLF